MNCNELKKGILEDILCGCVMDKMGLKLLFAVHWDHISHRLVFTHENQE